jgi:hypothetical protein
MLGIAYRLKGDWKNAGAALVQAGVYSAGLERGSALYLAADSQVHAGNMERAQKTLNAVAQIPGLGTSARAAAAQAKPGMTLPPLVFDPDEAKALTTPPVRPWNLNLNAALGYDSNVLLLPDSETAGQNPSTVMAIVGAQGDYSSKLLGWDVKGLYSASYNKNFNSLATTFDNIPLMMGLEWNVPGRWAEEHDLVFSQQVTASFVNTAGMGLFSNAVGIGVRAMLFQRDDHVIDANVPLTYNMYPGVTVASATDDRTGVATSPTVSHRHVVMGHAVSETIGYSQQFASGQNFQSTAISAAMTVGVDLPMQIVGNLAASASKTSYPRHTTGRSETKWNLGFELTRKVQIVVPLNANFAYGVENNSSTISSASYFKHSVLLKVGYDF